MLCMRGVGGDNTSGAQGFRGGVRLFSVSYNLKLTSSPSLRHIFFHLSLYYFFSVSHSLASPHKHAVTCEWIRWTWVAVLSLLVAFYMATKLF